MTSEATRRYGYNVPNSQHLTGNIYRLSWEGFIRVTLHCHERRRPPKLHIDTLHIRVKSLRVLAQLSDGYLVEIEEAK